MLSFRGVARLVPTQRWGDFMAKRLYSGSSRQMAPVIAVPPFTPLIHQKRSSVSIQLTYQPLDTKPQPNFHYQWLRDNCQCPQCLHPTTKQKLISSGQIPTHIKPVECKIIPMKDETSNSTSQVSTQDSQEDAAEKIAKKFALEIKWPAEHLRGIKDPNGHKSIYPLKFLMENQYTRDAIAQRNTDEFPPTLWTKNHLDTINAGRGGTLDIDFNEFMTSEKGLREFLDIMERYGFGFITGIPQTKDVKTGEKSDKLPDEKVAVEEIAKRFGPIRETFYGVSWDVKSVPNAKNIAYTSLFLGLHMDLMYFESPPGLQFLHCIENSVQGGEAIFVDVFTVCEKLRTKYPRQFDILTKVPVTFQYRNNGQWMRFRRPTIQLEGLNHQYNVYYAPPFQGPLECPSAHQMEEFYESFALFECLVNDPKNVWERRYQEGECVVFANRRVLHGRKEFDGLHGSRWLKGTYVDWDCFWDRLRVVGNKE